MNKLVSIEDKAAFTNSRIVADNCGIGHGAIMLLIKKYLKELNAISSSDVVFDSFKTGGRTGEMALLDEQQATLLVSLMRNSKKVVKFKLNLVRDSFKQKTLLASKIAQDVDYRPYLDHRLPYKSVSSNKLAVVKVFIDYASNQGCDHANKYYSLLADNVDFAAVSIINDQYQNDEEVSKSLKYVPLTVVDDLVENSLREGMDRYLNYKDIYKMAKDRLIHLSKMIGNSHLSEVLGSK